LTALRNEAAALTLYSRPALAIAQYAVLVAAIVLTAQAPEQLAVGRIRHGCRSRPRWSA
jgi:hypothetical protein